MSVFEGSNVLCDYGCGNEAEYTFKNGNRCCSKYPVQCESIREKISNSLKNYHENGERRRFELTKCKETKFFE